MITLNRPEAKNAVNAALAQGVAAALDELDSDGELNAGVITGAGGSFCAGMDLKAFVTGEFPYVEGRGFAGITQRSADKPIIAAIEGYALAGGLEVALSCDLLVASKRVEVRRARGEAITRGRRRRADPPAQADPVPRGDGAGAHRRLHLGRARLRAGAGQPHRRAGTSLDVALELAEAIAKNGPLALIASKKIVKNTHDWTEAEAWEQQARDHRPGVRVRGRDRGRHGLRREAPAGLEGPLEQLGRGGGFPGSSCSERLDRLRHPRAEVSAGEGAVEQLVPGVQGRMPNSTSTNVPPWALVSAQFQ